ncbi:MAG: sulfurtransferase TusA family protein [Phycisphaerae bacterium]|nr:sulfurtransferase TusA family protein [Phycisphaerae bacterium]
MATISLDCCGMRCPQPVLKIAAKAPEMPAGDILEVTADCPTFDKDVRAWCTRMNKTLLAVTDMGGAKKKAQIQF